MRCRATRHTVPHFKAFVLQTPSTFPHSMDEDERTAEIDKKNYFVFGKRKEVFNFTYSITFTQHLQCGSIEVMLIFVSATANNTVDVVPV